MPNTQTTLDAATALKAKEIKFQLPALEVCVVGKWVWVSGNTFPSRQRLLTLGLRWAREKAKWYWKPAGHCFKGRPKPYQAITAKYGEMRVQPLEQVA